MMSLNMWTALFVGGLLVYVIFGLVATAIIYLTSDIQPVGFIKRTFWTVVLVLIWPVALLKY